MDFPFFCGRHPLDESRCFRWVGHDNHLTDASMQGWNWVDYYVSDYNDAELQKVYLVASRDIIFPPQSASIPIKYNQLYVQNLHLSFCIQEYLLIWKNKCGKLNQLKRRNALNLNSKNEIKEAKVPLYASVNITSHIRRILKGRQSSKKGLRVGLGRICWSHHTTVSSRLSAGRRCICNGTTIWIATDILSKLLHSLSLLATGWRVPSKPARCPHISLQRVPRPNSSQGGRLSCIYKAPPPNAHPTSWAPHVSTLSTPRVGLLCKGGGGMVCTRFDFSFYF